MTEEARKRVLAFRVLTAIGLALLVVSFFTPMWWVSLKAPNYPEHTFPDGVRILYYIAVLKCYDPMSISCYITLMRNHNYSFPIVV